MSNPNEFILICTFHWFGKRLKKKLFGINLKQHKFNVFKKLRLKPAKLFPSNEKDKKEADRIVSEHLTTVRRFGIYKYVVAGCSLGGYAAATVSAKTMEAQTRNVSLPYTIHNFVMYKDILVVADLNHKIFVTGLDTPEDDRINLKDFTLCSTVVGCTSLTCGLHMETDVYKSYDHMAYIMCNENRLIRLNLKHIDPNNPKSTTDKLDVKIIHRSDKVACFYVAHTHVYVMADNMLTRIDKRSLAVKNYPARIPGDIITRIVGNDQYAYGVCGNSLQLLGICGSVATSLSSVVAAKYSSDKTRLLIPGQFRGVNFVIRLHETPVAISIYAALKHKLHIILEHVIEPASSRVLGGIYDEKIESIIISQETGKSQVIQLVY